MAIDNVQPYIKFTSPDGNEFSARWSGNEESKDKAVGIFHSPGTVGEKVQDQGSKSPRIPLSFFFSGDDSTAVGKSFFSACDEFGVWEVDHPEDGIRSLQLLTVSIDKQPVTSGNVRSFTTSWIEPVIDISGASSAELKAGIEADVEDLNNAGSTELDDAISQAQQAEITSFTDSIENIISNVKEGTASIFEDSGLAGVADVAIGAFNTVQTTIADTKESIATVQEEFNKIEQSITDAVDAAASVALAPATIALQIQELIQSPSRAIENIQNRINAYKETNSLMMAELTGKKATIAGKNSVQTTQLGLTAVLSATCLSVTTGELQTREEALSAADDIAQMQADAVEALDTAAALFSGSDIENQFFSQTESYNRLSQIIAKAIKILISLSFDLKVEKRFTLTADKSPVQVCVEEYGLLGENDEIFTYFCETNNLYGTELLLLKTGFEVVVYK